MLVKVPRKLKVSSLNYICWKIPGACSCFSFSATLWNHSLFYSDVLFFFSCIQPISHGWCIVNTLNGFQWGCAPCVCTAEAGENGISLLVSAPGSHTVYCSSCTAPQGLLATSVDPRRRLHGGEVAEPLRTLPRERGREEEPESICWVKAEPRNQDCLALCLAAADNGQVSSPLCFCLPICKVRRINKFGTLSSGKVHAVRKVS